ncbi:MAG: MBL fold metallo-hydrolase [Nitrospira sp.]|nr:MBL fold metallo-hydrolase [Nitrospira sp.]
MKLIVLGSGTCVPSLKRNAPGYYLEVSDKHILIDCGSGTLLQLEKAGKSYRSIDAVFITHTHPDHISDLLPLIHALSATPGFKREKDLLLVGPGNLKKFYDSCIASVIRKPKTYVITVIEMEEKLDLGYVHVFSRKTIHSENSIAFRFQEGEKALVITGDCDYEEGIVELSKDADLLIIDCSFPNAMKVPGHLTPVQCGLVAKRAKVKKLLLSHLYPTPSHDADRVKECREIFGGDVSLAEDLMENII